MKLLRRFATETRGATAVEYGLMCALISVIAIASVVLLGEPINGLFGGIVAHFNDIELVPGS